MTVLTCIICRGTLPDLGDIQPKGGLAFHTCGHYGSMYFDPMDGSTIHVVICDDCVADAVEVSGMAVYRDPPEQDASK